MTDTDEQRINLEDNSEKESSNMADKEEQEPSQEQQITGSEELKGEKAGWYEKPEGMGNSAGEWVQGKLNPVGQYAGKGFETVGKPVGGLVEPLVGGLMKSGEGFGDTLGVGFGNKEGGPAKQQEAEGERMKEPIAGQEQNGENPLGLNPKAS